MQKPAGINFRKQCYTAVVEDC